MTRIEFAKNLFDAYGYEIEEEDMIKIVERTLFWVKDKTIPEKAEQANPGEDMLDDVAIGAWNACRNAMIDRWEEVLGIPSPKEQDHE